MTERHESLTAFRARVYEFIRSDTSTPHAPETLNLEFRVCDLCDLLNKTEDRQRKYGENLQTEIAAIKQALDELPQKALQAGISRRSVAKIIASKRWQNYRGLLDGPNAA